MPRVITSKTKKIINYMKTHNVIEASYKYKLSCGAIRALLHYHSKKINKDNITLTNNALVVSNNINKQEQDNCNHRWKGIFYHLLWNKIEQDKLFINGGNMLTIPGMSGLAFEKIVMKNTNIDNIILLEKEEKVCKFIKEDKDAENNEKYVLRNDDVFNYIQDTRRKFDIIWLDLYGLPSISNLSEVINEVLNVNGYFLLTTSYAHATKIDKNKYQMVYGKGKNQTILNRYDFVPDNSFQIIPIMGEKDFAYGQMHNTLYKKIK